MTEKNDPERLKLCFDLRLIGGSTIAISPVTIDPLIWEFPNTVFFVGSDGYVLEKSTDIMKYSIYRLTMPYLVGEKQRKMCAIYTFTDDATRYTFVKKLKYNLTEFTRCGFFGHNPKGRVVAYNNYWFVY